MEQFKLLKWSWYKYEEEKEIPPRNFNFGAINDADALNRNLNEIHMSVLKDQHEYRLFKTTEELTANSFQKKIDDDKIFELQDPRKQSIAKLKSSFELMKCYSYFSELNKSDQLSLLNAIEDKLTHNPKILKQKNRFFRKKSNNHSIQLDQKWQNESVYFNNSAKVYYHRHIKELGTILREDLAILISVHWERVKNELKDYNYQSITMITRNTISKSTTEIKHIDDKSEIFNSQMYMMTPSSFFCTLRNYSTENIRHYLKRQQTANFWKNIENINYDLKLSLDVLKNLFLPKKEFITSFKNYDGKTNFSFDYSIPLQSVDYCEALEEAIQAILITNIEWNNICENLKFPKKENEIEKKFKCETINKFMEKIYSSYKNQAKENTELNLWSIENESQSYIIFLKSQTYFVRKNVRAIISIKLEYQTNFGAEQITKDELLKEWIQIKLTKNSVIFRYRIDAKTYEILSIQELQIDDIEHELQTVYNCNPTELLEVTFNLIRCIRNLPDGNYLILARNENECSKFLIYREDANGKSLPDLKSSFQISQTFNRPWVPIDMKTITFLHLNEFVAPCCFSYRASNKSSYVIKTTETSIKKNAKQKISKTQKRNLARKKKSASKKLRKSKRVVKKKIIEKKDEKV